MIVIIKEQRGFTLLELMVALAIFAMLAVAGWQVFDSVSRAREQAQVQADHLAVLQQAYLQIQQDLGQIIAYQTLEVQNTSLQNGSDDANNQPANNQNNDNNNNNNNNKNPINFPTPNNIKTININTNCLLFFCSRCFFTLIFLAVRNT